MQGPYARHSSKPIGAKIDPRQGLLAPYFDKPYQATAVNPYPVYKVEQLILTAFHLLVWVAAAGTSCTFDFHLPVAMGNLTNESNANNYTVVASQKTIDIGMTGGIFMIAGVVFILITTISLTKDQYKDMPSVHDFIQCCTLLGITCTVYVFCKASAETDNPYWTLGLVAVLLSVYAQTLFYSTSVVLNVKYFSRSFLIALALSLQIVSAIAINSGDLASNATDNQKTIALWTPIATGTGIGLSIFYQVVDSSKMGEAYLLPYNAFSLSFVRFSFAIATLLSGYKVAFVKNDPDPVSFSFATAGAVMSIVVFFMSLQSDVALKYRVEVAETFEDKYNALFDEKNKRAVP